MIAEKATDLIRSRADVRQSRRGGRRYPCYDVQQRHASKVICSKRNLLAMKILSMARQR